MSQQPVGRVRRAPEEQSHQRDDPSVVGASDGERDRVESYMSKAWTEEASTRTRQQQCMKLSSHIVNTITVSDEANEIATLLGVRAQPKPHDIIIVCDVTDKESFNSVKDWTGEIDKHVFDGVSRLFVENQCDVTSKEELSTDVKRRSSRIT